MNTLMAKAFLKKTTLFATAFVLAVSTLTAAVPFILSKDAGAIAPYNLTAAPYCKDGLVAFDVIGTNPAGGQSAVYVKSSAAFKLSDPVLAQPGATVSVPLFTDLTSVAASAVTIYVSDTENGTYTYLNDPSAVAPYAAFNCTNDVYVATAADNGNDANNGTSVARPFATIQKAIDTVNANGTVHVAAGTYAGSTNVNKAVTIQGAQAGIDARNRSGVETVLTTSGTASNFNVTASNVVIDGFTLNGPTGDSAALNLMGTFSGTTVKNNIVNNSSRAAVFNTSNTTFTKNRINNTSATTISGFEENSNAANNVVVDSNDFYNGNNNADINFIGAANTQSTGLVVKNNNSFDGTTLLGVTNTLNAAVTNNTANGNLNSVIFLGGNNKGTQIDGNIIANSNAAGAAVVVINPFGYGANSDIKGRNNSFAGSVNGVVVYPTGIATGQQGDFSGNWWGASNGPTDPTPGDGSQLQTNNGSGAGAHGVVKYNSWCVNAQCNLYSDSTLAAPTDLTPATNTFTNNPDFNNTWTVVNGAAGYEYQTSYSSNGTTLGSIVYTDSSAAQPTRYSVSGSTVTRTNIDAPDADYYWQVRAINAEGIAGPWSEINKVTVDTQAPSIMWQVQPKSHYGQGAGFAVRPITLTNEVTTLKEVYIDTVVEGKLVWRLDSDHRNFDTSNENNQALWDSLANGTHKFIAVFTDKAGNSTTSSSDTFIVDRTAPTVTVKPASLGNSTAGVYRNVSFALFDSYQIDKLTLNGTAKELSNNNYSDLNGVRPGQFGAVEGQNTLVVFDVAGNKTTVVFTLDTTAPDASFTYSNNGNATKSDVTVNLTATEEIQTPATWTQVNTTTYTKVFTANTTGSVTITDVAGNTSTKNFAVTGIDKSTTSSVDTNDIDTTVANPTITGRVTYVADGTPVANQPIVVTIDDEDYTTTTNVDGEWSIDAEDLTDGEHIITVNGTERARFTTEIPAEEDEDDTTTAPAAGTPTTPIPLAAIETAATTPAIVSPAGLAGVLGNATDNNAANNGAAVEGASTENADTVAAADTEANRGSFLGLGWYWWILIIAALAAIAWWIVAAVRKRQEA